MHHQTHPLITAAEIRMRQSSDPIHDYAHAKRTAQYAEKLGRDARVRVTYLPSLVIAAWWHDVARTITKNPSFIWMPFVDDLLSALMLWWHAIRTGTLDQHAGLAVRLIACKSIGTGAFLTRILTRKRERLFVDILHDADKLDQFNLERMTKVLEVTQSSAVYRVGYRVLCRWHTLLNYIRVKTDAAKKYLLQVLRQFIVWLKQPPIYAWHVAAFGASWSKKNLRHLERLISRLTVQLASGTV